MSIGIIDTIALCVLIFSILFALYRGLITELLGISSWILACFGAIYSYTPMQGIMHKFIENEKLAGLCGSILIALLILILMTIINAHINRKLRQSSLSGLDRLLGMGFGILRAVLLMALLYMGAEVALSEPAMKDMEKENVSMPYIRQTAEFLKKFVPQNVQDDLGIGEKAEEKEKQKIGTELNHTHKLPGKSHKKAIKNLVEEIKENPKKATTSEKSMSKTDKKEEKAAVHKEHKPDQLKHKPVVSQPTHTPAPIKTVEPKPVAPQPDHKSGVTPPSSVAAPTVQYNLKERESLDNMVEQIMEKEK